MTDWLEKLRIPLENPALYSLFGIAVCTLVAQAGALCGSFFAPTEADARARARIAVLLTWLGPLILLAPVGVLALRGRVFLLEAASGYPTPEAVTRMSLEGAVHSLASQVAISPWLLLLGLFGWLAAGQAWACRDRSRSPFPTVGLATLAVASSAVALGIVLEGLWGASTYPIGVSADQVQLLRQVEISESTDALYGARNVSLSLAAAAAMLAAWGILRYGGGAAPGRRTPAAVVILGMGAAAFVLTRPYATDLEMHRHQVDRLSHWHRPADPFWTRSRDMLTEFEPTLPRVREARPDWQGGAWLAAKLEASGPGLRLSRCYWGRAYELGLRGTWQERAKACLEPGPSGLQAPTLMLDVSIPGPLVAELIRIAYDVGHRRIFLGVDTFGQAESAMLGTLRRPRWGQLEVEIADGSGPEVEALPAGSTYSAWVGEVTQKAREGRIVLGIDPAP